MKTTITTKHKGIEITNTPSDKYPNLVTLTKTVKKAQSVLNKQFLTLEHALKYIDNLELHLWERQTQLRLEKQERTRAERELLKLNGLNMLKS
jgi:hypothetical protein